MLSKNIVSPFHLRSLHITFSTNFCLHLIFLALFSLSFFLILYLSFFFSIFLPFFLYLYLSFCLPFFLSFFLFLFLIIRYQGQWPRKSGDYVMEKEKNMQHQMSNNNQNQSINGNKNSYQAVSKFMNHILNKIIYV